MPAQRPDDERRSVPGAVAVDRGEAVGARATGDPATPAAPFAPAPTRGTRTDAVGRTAAPAHRPAIPGPGALAPVDTPDPADDDHEPGDHPASVLAGR